MIEHFHRYIGVTEGEEAILLRALIVHRDLLRNLAGKKYGARAHREEKARKLATIEALMARAFPENDLMDMAMRRGLSAGQFADLVKRMNGDKAQIRTVLEGL